MIVLAHTLPTCLIKGYSQSVLLSSLPVSPLGSLYLGSFPLLRLGQSSEAQRQMFNIKVERFRHMSEIHGFVCERDSLDVKRLGNHPEVFSQLTEGHMFGTLLCIESK